MKKHEKTKKKTRQKNVKKNFMGTSREKGNVPLLLSPHDKERETWKEKVNLLWLQHNLKTIYINTKTDDT